MALTIWKYELRPDGATVGIPEGFKVLDVQVQHKTVCVWALVDPEAEQVSTTFRVYGTGHDLPPEVAAMEYVGTFQLHGGSLVFHVFMSAVNYAQGQPATAVRLFATSGPRGNPSRPSKPRLRGAQPTEKRHEL